ncbi:ZC3H15/TMA46 family [Trypanosoma melophagium]|uniref:ZC3H15/TMA46 family n=1 Tax=Trypanosoma melophagium TaxID=715481 RepID=UPI00351A2408|nr:ZC3H15/TMA46 family [Trypanosoma melophagium]
MGKKAEQKRKEKIVEDKTFGLKNKNRSAKVQSYIQSVSKSVTQGNQHDRKRTEDLEAKRKAREEKKAFEAEMAKLFREVGGAAPPGGRSDSAPAEDPVEETDRNLGCAPEEYLFRPEDFDEVQRDERRLEEQLEAQREALRGRTDLTPVTEESFQAWKAAQREAAAAAEALRVRRAKAGEGGGRLRGWDLWQMDRELFVDDEDADEAYEREEEDEEDVGGAYGGEGEDVDESAYDLS